jgi:hypothetical protein
MPYRSDVPTKKVPKVINEPNQDVPKYLALVLFTEHMMLTMKTRQATYV